jgi:hypothetical protein
MVRGWAEERHPHLRGREAAHHPIERVGIVEGSNWHGVILAETERTHGRWQESASDGA